MSKAVAKSAGPGRRPRTSREQIVECAIRMLARDGSEALTFRAVAREMNIAVGAFSRYFKSRAELEDEIAATIVSKLTPLDAAGKQGLREQLLRLCMDWLQITRTYPALATMHGPASATTVAGHLGQVVKVMAESGIELERALMTYSMAINLAYSWGLQFSRQTNMKLRKKSFEAFTRQAGEFAPEITRLITQPDTTEVYRRSFAVLIDGLLPVPTITPRKR